MTRKDAKAILNGLDITNRFTLKTVGFEGRTTLQVLVVKDWRPDPKANQIKAAFKGHGVIVDFESAKDCTYIS